MKARTMVALLRGLRMIVIVTGAECLKLVPTIPRTRLKRKAGRKLNLTRMKTLFSYFIEKYFVSVCSSIIFLQEFDRFVLTTFFLTKLRNFSDPSPSSRGLWDLGTRPGARSRRQELVDRDPGENLLEILLWMLFSIWPRILKPWKPSQVRNRNNNVKGVSKNTTRIAEKLSKQMCILRSRTHFKWGSKRCKSCCNLTQ